MACRLVGAKPLSEPVLGILFIGPWETNFSEILIGIQTFSFKKMHLKMLSAKWRPFCLDLNVLRVCKETVKSRVCLMFHYYEIREFIKMRNKMSNIQYLRPRIHIFRSKTQWLYTDTSIQSDIKICHQHMAGILGMFFASYRTAGLCLINIWPINQTSVNITDLVISVNKQEHKLPAWS